MIYQKQQKKNRNILLSVSLAENQEFEEQQSDSVEGDGMKIIFPSNIIDLYTTLETLLGIKLCGNTETLTDASNLINQLCKRGGIQNGQQCRNALGKIPIV